MPKTTSLPATIGAINKLPASEKQEIYRSIIPSELLERFNLNPYMVDSDGNDLLTLRCEEGSADTEMELRHQFDFPDPILYGHIADTLTGHLNILLYIINDPNSPRFDIDRLADGTLTNLGADHRNLAAEAAALQAGLAPGQIRRGLKLFAAATITFENFAAERGHEIFFVEPLYYHNAYFFEQLGFTYTKGRKLMERIQAGFAPGGDLLALLDGSTPFRQPAAATSIRLRSWAIHDNLLGEPFTNVTMYKQIGKPAGVNTCPGCKW